MPTEECDGLAIRSELERILLSAAFSWNERQSRFLRLLVERHLEGRNGELKESVLAVEVFDRKPDYDPKLDAIVRTEAVRLRSRLSAYYAGEGSADPMIVELPKGGYKPVFRRREAERERRITHSSRVWLAAGALVVLTGASAAMTWS